MKDTRQPTSRMLRKLTLALRGRAGANLRAFVLFVMAIAIAGLLSLAAHRIQIQRYSGLCDLNRPTFFQEFRRLSLALSPAKDAMVNLSKALGGSSIRLYFYNNTEPRMRMLITEDIDESLASPEERLPEGEFPLAEDDFYLAQFDAHNQDRDGGGFFMLVEDIEPGLLKSQAMRSGVTHIASAPILNADGYPEAYIEIHFKGAPTSSESAIIQQLISVASRIGYDLT